ncbi:MAG: hypothetical protein BA866_05775 [Desulfobulbaceae bacterium S5133MH15]|nr:MAG: hypothetical protein BA866_05775 [Desulfobulbaceae bacterium S5133MH15]OEU84646.1 MAG: hypothetical protein BA873_14190 [Desulfobulbaceae bacterium C00003063]
MKKMTWLVIGIVIIAICVIVAVSKKGSVNKLRQTVRIGAILPLTGPGATFAQYIRDGIDLAVQEINTQSDPVITVFYEDCKNQPKVGIAAYNKLISTEKPPVTIVALSSVAKALAPLAEHSQSIQMYIAVAIPNVTDGRFRFRLYPDANGMAGVMAHYTAESLNAKKAAVLYINDEFGRASLDAYRNVFQKYGGTVIFSETYNLLQTDFRAQIAKLKDITPQPDVIYLNGYGPSYGAIIKQLKEQGVTVILTADMTLGLPNTLQQIGEAGEGAFFVDGKMSQNFVEKFDAKYSRVATSYAGYAYDIVNILYTIARTTDRFTVEVIRKGMHEIRNYEGAMGNITMGPDGDSNLEFVVKQIKNGQVVVVQE